MKKPERTVAERIAIATDLAVVLIASGHCIIILGDDRDGSYAMIDIGPMMVGG